MELYKKVGRRYVKHDDYLDEKGLPCGLYLFYRPNDKGEHQGMMNMIHYAKVHEIQNVAKFSDLYSAHGKVISDAIYKCLLKSTNISASDLTNEILSKLSDL